MREVIGSVWDDWRTDSLQMLGFSYLEQAARVRLSMRALEVRLPELKGVEAAVARDELRIMAGMLRDLREVGGYAIHYRDRRFCRNGMCAAWPGG